MTDILLDKTLAPSRADDGPDMKPTAPPVNHSWFRKFKNIAVATLVIASLVHVLQGWGLLTSLENATFRLVAHFSFPVPVLAEGSMAPAVALIDTASYEINFGEASPLDRRKLAAIIDDLADQRPALIAIDLDLSPDKEFADGGYRFASRGDRDAQQAVDLAVARAAGSGIDIVLILPQRLTGQRMSEKRGWMESLTSSGHGRVHFTTSTVQVDNGVVLYFSDAEPTLGYAAASVMKRRLAQDAGSHGVAAGHGDAPGHGGDAGHDDGKVRSINPRYLEFLETDLVRPGLTMADAPGTPLYQRHGWTKANSIQGRPVFLGFGDAFEDRFMTVKGVKPGVFVHAAVFYSIFDNAGVTSHLWGFVFDIFIGIVLGLAFELVWERRNQRYRQFRTLASGAGPFLSLARLYNPWRTTGVRELHDGWAWYLYALGYASINVLLLAAAVVGLLATASTMVAAGWWLNPGPILLGLFIHTNFASRAGLLDPEESDADGERHAVSRSAPGEPLLFRRLGLIAYGIKLSLFAGLVGWTVYSLNH